MLIIPQAKTYQKHRKYRAKPPIPPSGPVLISAVYSINDALVTLTFDQAIVTDDIDTHAFKIYDGLYSNQILDGATYGAEGSDGIVVYFDQLESFTSSTCTMNVSNASGIKSVSSGTAWEGVTGFVLTIG